MKTINALVINAISTAFLSLIPIIIWFGLFLDRDTNGDGYWMILVAFILNAIITGMIHLLIFLPSIIVYQRKTNLPSRESAFEVLSLGLLIPLSLYSLIMYAILRTADMNQENLVLAVFIGAGFMTIHSLSLYTLLIKIIPSKKENHEEINPTAL